MKFSAHERARSRRFALQALYQWDLSGIAPDTIHNQFLEAEDFSRADAVYFAALLTGVTKEVEVIDSAMASEINRPVDQLDPVERTALRIAIYELLFRDDVPGRVVINEAVNLTKKFGAEKSHTFVNGVLDKVAHKKRPAEFGPSERANGR